VNVPLGDLLKQCAEQTLDKSKKYVCVCNVGYRSMVAATQLVQQGYTAFSLQGGAAAITAPIAAWFQPQFVVVLTTRDPEKVTLALSVATASQANGRATAIVCMGEAPLLFRQAGLLPDEGQRASELNVGEPFKAGAAILSTFGSAGGRVFACKSCVKFHKLSYDEMESIALPMQAPDLVRMSCGAQGTVTFG
jgi:predicted peroxiredoxin